MVPFMKGVNKGGKYKIGVSFENIRYLASLGTGVTVETWTHRSISSKSCALVSSRCASVIFLACPDYNPAILKERRVTKEFGYVHV